MPVDDVADLAVLHRAILDGINEFIQTGQGLPMDRIIQKKYVLLYEQIKAGGQAMPVLPL